MLAAHIDQENFVHGQQTAAAAKPLNQGARGYGPKTPGRKAPKTPFKVPLNDENVLFRGGKSALKTNGKAEDKATKLAFDKSAFQTPAGPRNRQALGAKTTNAKANLFTPGPNRIEASALKTVQKTGSPRLRRNKVKIHQPEVTPESDDDDVGYERMPPPAEPLSEFSPDDEFGLNKTFPQLAPENLTRDCALVYLNPTDDAGLTRIDHELAARKARAQREDELELTRLMDDTFAAVERDVLRDLERPTAAAAAAARAKPAPATVTARSAASALSRAPTKAAVGTGAFAAPTKASGARAPLAMRKSRVPAQQASVAERQPPVSSSAAAASRSTLGYSRGRAVSQKVRKPGALVFRDGAAKAEGARGSAGRSASEAEFQAKVRDVVIELRAHGLRDEDDGLFGSAVPVDDDEYADFQLAL